MIAFLRSLRMVSRRLQPVTETLETHEDELRALKRELARVRVDIEWVMGLKRKEDGRKGGRPRRKEPEEEAQVVAQLDLTQMTADEIDDAIKSGRIA